MSTIDYANISTIHNYLRDLYEVTFNPERWPLLLEGLEKCIPLCADEATSLHTELVLPQLELHFSHALKIAREVASLDQQKRQIATILEYIPMGIILVSPYGTVLHYNTHAHRLCQSTPLKLALDQPLSTRNEQHNAALAQLIAKAASNPERPQSYTLEFQDKAPLMMVISSLNHDAVQGMTYEDCIAIFINHDRALNDINLKLFAEAYQLSSRETLIAEHIVHGHSPAEISRLLQISEHTVRSQLKAIFRKTQVSKQSELVARVMTSPSRTFSLAYQRVSNRTKSHYFQLKDKRMMGYRCYGEASGKPVVYCHSIVGCRHESPLSDCEAKQLGIYLIVPDRPGYGNSCCIENNIGYCAWSEDLTQLLDHLNINTFGIVGYGNGGLYAMAVAHQLAKRVERLLLSSCVDYSNIHAYQDKLSAHHRLHYLQIRHYPELHRLMASLLSIGIHKAPNLLLQLHKNTMTASEKAFFEAREFDLLYRKIASEAFKQHNDILGEEAEKLFRQWDFSPEVIDVETVIYHGIHDKQSPLILSELLAKRIPNASLRTFDNYGQWLLFQQGKALLSELTKQPNVPAVLLPENA